MQALPLKQTIWTHSSLTQPFNYRENITKQIFCFLLRYKVRPKKSSKSLNSSFLSAPSTKQPTSRHLAALHPGKIECSLRGKNLSQTNLILFVSLCPGFNNTLNVFQSVSQLIETSISASCTLVRQGSFPFMAPCL